MAKVSVYTEVDLGEFSTEELLAELRGRVADPWLRVPCKDMVRYLREQGYIVAKAGDLPDGLEDAAEDLRTGRTREALRGIAREFGGPFRVLEDLCGHTA